MKKEEQEEKVEKEDILWLNDIKKSREITREILRFGVTQPQIKCILSFLALELEDRDLMLQIRNAIDPAESAETDSNHIKILNPEVN